MVQKYEFISDSFRTHKKIPMRLSNTGILKLNYLIVWGGLLSLPPGYEGTKFHKNFLVFSLVT